MIKNIIGGIAIGIANVIPGVSGGTMMVILGIFNRMMEAISGIFKRVNPNRKDDIIFIFQVLVGAAIGIVGFAKILEILFEYYPTQTIYWFIGLIAFSIPLFVKGEMKGEKLAIVPFVCGLAIIFGLEFLNPGEGNTVVNPDFPPLSSGLFIKMVIIGAISGATMIMPGVSGSMVLLILGEYYLFKSYLAHVTSFSLDVIMPLGFMAIGIAFGIVVSAKLCQYFTRTHKAGFLSLILGLIIASSLVLIPFDVSYDFNLILTSLLAALFGGIIVFGLSKIQ
ncbi:MULTISPECIES: DUF368 domain-containing protein [unclassified Thomasclavelia]|uniref:DUF368 domain-containing protein n=1 Tax=unclassified Thomasclavelia TaxID=3025756 RepID=UPI000B388962|nr:MULTISPECIES: DUF368 domain-containing protein [unclassified Thomasclavelia]OUQ07813.1 DUF368 domain-containing protein [Erysipelatoclostridium sp. An15]